MSRSCDEIRPLRPVLHLYRPQIPSLRAQDIQVIHTSAALAALGHPVTVVTDPGPGGGLSVYGLGETPGLRLISPGVRHRGLRGLSFRGHVCGWLASRQGHGPARVIYARTWRYAAEVLRLRRLLPFRLVFEAHEVPSAQAADAGEPGVAALHQLEARVLEGADGLVTNCGGTMDVIRERHGDRLPGRRAAIHNATHPSRAVRPRGGSNVAGYLGSLHGYKATDTLAAAAALLPPGARLAVVGGLPEEEGYQRMAGLAGIDLLPRVPYGEVPGLLSTMGALVISLRDDLYGRRLASPLKLWDYLATGLPLVAPDLPSVREICGEAFHPYRPEEPASLARAVVAALASSPGPPRVRTWDDRAQEISTFLLEIP